MTKEQYIISRYNDYLHYWASIGLKFGPIVTLSLIPLDYFASPQNFSTFLAYRFCTAAVLFLLYLYNRKMTNQKRVNVSIMLAATAVSAMVALMVAKFGGHQSPYAVGFILVGIFVSGIVPLSFGACLMSSLIVYAIYLIPVLLYEPITNVPYFASESILIFACISTMLIMRYFANKRLFHEFELQFDVEQYKTHLEEQVEDRTHQLSTTIMHLEQEVQDREQAEKELIESKNNWEDTFNTINDAITIHDRDFNIERVNSAAERLLGKSVDELLGNKCFRSYHGTDRAPEGCPSCLTLQNGIPSVTELFEPHLDKYLEIKALPRHDRQGALVGVIHIVRDITERKRAEEALSEQQDFASNLIENSAVATFVLDSSHRIMLWNKACEELTGCTREEMIGTTNQWQPFYGEQRPTIADVIIDSRRDDLDELYQNYSSSSLNPLAIKAEGWYKNLGGRDRYISFEASPIFNSSRTLIAAIETLQDITERKRLEEQLLQAQKIEAVGQLAGGVAHDFNNILTAIVGYAHLTLMKMPQDEPLRKNVEQILQASDKAAALTQSLLAFSRKQIMTPKPVDLNDIVKRLEKLLIRLIREDIQIATTYTADALTIFADTGQIEQVLMNLVTNARDAMPLGGRIVIKTETMQMDSHFIEAHGYGKAGKYALLSVSDNGQGMEAKIRERIFEPFFTTKEQGKGTGLGLAMVYGIIKQHEGFIDVYSEPGKGTTFKIYLQLSTGRVEHEKVQEESVAIKGGAETVLVAEDDSALRKLMITILHNQGYTVIDAIDGEDAVQKYSNNSDVIQLLILDGIMPKKNGKEALEEIRLINPNVKALFVSGYAEDIISKQGLLEPGINFIQKPLSPSVLLNKMRELLDAKC